MRGRILLFLLLLILFQILVFILLLLSGTRWPTRRSTRMPV